MGAKFLHNALTSVISQKLLPERRTAIVDVFLISGAGATQDTVTPLCRAIGKVIMLAHCFGLGESITRVLERKDYLGKSKPRIDWSDREERVLGEYRQKHLRHAA